MFRIKKIVKPFVFSSLFLVAFGLCYIIIAPLLGFSARLQDLKLHQFIVTMQILLFILAFVIYSIMYVYFHVLDAHKLCEKQIAKGDYPEVLDFKGYLKKYALIDLILYAIILIPPTISAAMGQNYFIDLIYLAQSFPYSVLGAVFGFIVNLALFFLVYMLATYLSISYIQNHLSLRSALKKQNTDIN